MRGSRFAAEIRAHVKASGAPAMAAMAMAKDRRAVAALLEGPPFLWGGTEQEAAALRDAAVEAAEPGVVPEVRELNDALAVCRGAIASANALIAERSQIRKTHDGYVTPTGDKIEATRLQEHVSSSNHIT